MADTWEDQVGDDIYTCPHCHTDECVPPSGPKSSRILIVGEAPGKEEIKRGKPFCGATGEVFRKELARVGLNIYTMRICNIWHHEPNSSDECSKYGLEQVIKESKDRDVILLVGSDSVRKLTKYKVSEVTGLEVKSPYLSAPLIMACIQPANVFNNVVGDLRLSLQKFAQKVEKYL